ncbi:MAG TPA: alpha/beta fold hydrolase [Anaerolineales bacterium]|nr:alpha/beta fold hydrolase [Anaerolineales bacterium]
MPTFFPIIFVHGWGGPADIVRDFGAADERDPYVGWNTGRRYNDPDGWIKFRNTELNFEGLVLRLVKDFGYYDASNDEELADFKSYLGMKPPAPGETSPPGVREAALHKSLWIFRYYEYNAEHLQLSEKIRKLLADELTRCGYPVKVEDLAGIPYYAALLALKIEQIACATCHSLSDGKEAPGLGLKKVALVGHSMGGLISRFAMQYNLFGAAENVARLMTMATPHGGARYASAANLFRFLPGLRDDDIQFFTPEWVTKFMGGQTPLPPINNLAQTDVFCLIGTRHNDYYPVARHLPRTDGVVDQNEAYLNNYPYAYVYNTHSGEHGIRENHDAYQSMRRFLFGDLYVRMQITDVDMNPGKKMGDGRLFFHYFVKPRGINTHLNELSERAENQPRPRTLTELKQRLAERPYIIYDGFADSGALVDKMARMGPGVLRSKKDLPHFQLEYSTFLSDERVGGRALASGYKMIPLVEGTRTLTLEDQVMKVKLRVEVRRRD